MIKIDCDTNFFHLISNIAINAGKKIISEHHKKNVEYKSDGSPVTSADKIANEFIVQSLQTYNSKIPILSEESNPNPDLLNSDILWAVDPLDGTKEFISNSPDFTVNIALIKNCYPIFGVIYGPVCDTLWLGYHERDNYECSKSYKLTNAFHSIKDSNPNWKKISVDNESTVITVLTSKSHKSNKLHDWVGLNCKNKDIKIIEKGSSLKICYVADGTAHLYPRFGRTCIWDTAAGHAIVNSSGGSITVLGSKFELKYEKGIYNPDFLVSHKSY